MKILRLSRFSKILSGLVIFLILVLFAAPRLARWYIVNNGKELTGRRISIDRIRVNYFTGTLTIRDLKLFEADEKTLFLGFGRLKVNLDYLPLFRHEISVAYITLDEPYAEVLQNGSRFNFSDLMKSDTIPEAKDTVPAAPTMYDIRNIRISKGYIKYTDLALNHTISLDSLDLQIPGFKWNSGSTNLDVNFNFVDGGGLYSKLDINQADSTYSISLKLDSLNLGIFEPYVKNYLNVTAFGGFLSNDLILKGSLQSIMRLTVSGENQVYGFGMKDSLGRTVFSADRIGLVIDTFSLDRNRVRLSKVEMTNPYLFIELADSSNNISALIRQTGEEQEDTSGRTGTGEGSGPEFSYNFPPVVITGGKVVFSDKTLGYPFDYHIEDLSLKISEKDREPGRLSYAVSAGLNGTGSFSSDGTIDPANLNDLDLILKISGFRMKDVDPYFKHYFGFPVTGGIMNFSTDNKLRPNSLESSNTIFFRRFTLGERLKGKTEYKVPLRLAIGILSDKDGIIDLKAPVKMKGEEIKILNLGRIIFRIIGNLFVKAATAPFNLISGLYNTNPGSLQEIRLGLDQASPDAKDLRSVDIIADFLNKKPLLSADFIYCINRKKASDTLAYIIALRDYLKEPGNPQGPGKNVADTTLMKFIRMKTGGIVTPADTTLQALCLKFTGAGKLTAALDSIGRIQAAYLSGYLGKGKGIPPERFKVIGTTPDTIIPAVKYPSFRIYFKAAELNETDSKK